MSKKQPPRVQLNFEPDYEPEKKPDLDINIKDLDVSEGVDMEDDYIPKVQEKEKIIVKDIFDNINEEKDEETGEVNPNFIYSDNIAVLPDEVKETLMEEGIKPMAPKPKQKKARKPMSEEHKKKLALAREKAMAVRKAKAEEKKKMKALENEEKELLKAQKVKKVQKLKKEIEEPVEEVVQKPPTNFQQVSGLTKKDLEDAQFEAIVKYETMRKQRKAEKKQAQLVEETKKEMLRKITPQPYKYRDGSNRWDMCY